jgi:hypothetical protein
MRQSIPMAVISAAPGAPAMRRSRPPVNGVEAFFSPPLANEWTLCPRGLQQELERVRHDDAYGRAVGRGRRTDGAQGAVVGCRPTAGGAEAHAVGVRLPEQSLLRVCARGPDNGDNQPARDRASAPGEGGGERPAQMCMRALAPCAMRQSSAGRPTTRIAGRPGRAPFPRCEGRLGGRAPPSAARLWVTLVSRKKRIHGDTNCGWPVRPSTQRTRNGAPMRDTSITQNEQAG